MPYIFVPYANSNRLGRSLAENELASAKQPGPALEVLTILGAGCFEHLLPMNRRSPSALLLCNDFGRILQSGQDLVHVSLE